jgi:nucleotide-binding universal stress UspA family protein
MTPDAPTAGGGVFRRILVGYDGSAEAQRALGVGSALAADLRGETHVLLVVRPGAHAETTEERDRALEAEHANLSKGLSSLEAQTQHSWELTTEAVYADDPAQAIAAYAEEHGFDLVVVGGHGREQPTHRGIGRSLEALLRHHPCPVLVV